MLSEPRATGLRLSLDVSLLVEELRKSTALIGRIAHATRNIAPGRVKRSWGEYTGLRSTEVAVQYAAFSGETEDSSFSRRRAGRPSETLVHLAEMHMVSQILQRDVGLRSIAKRREAPDHTRRV